MREGRPFGLKDESSRLLILLLIITASVALAFYGGFAVGAEIVYTHVFYIPVILAGMWYHKKAVYVALFLGIVHIVLSHLSDQVATKDNLARYAILTAVAYAIGLISEKRAKGEEELRETRDYLGSLIHYANASIIVWDRERRITRFNRASEHLTGYRTDEVIGQELSMLFPEPSRDESLSKIERAFNGECWESVEIPILRKDGDIRVALWNSADIYAGDGTTIIATLTQAIDITERKRLEAETEKIRQQAFQSSRLASIGELAAGVAHEINNPLTGVIGFSELLLERDLDPKVKSDLEKILRDGRRAQKVVQDLLLFARGQHTEEGYFDLNEAIKDTVSLVRRQFELDNIRVEEHFDALPQWYGNRGQLQEVFLNLLQNAHNAILSTSLKAGLTRKKGSFVRISTRVEGERIVLRIQDDGPGMSDAVREKVFDPFFTTKEAGKGTGLGLSMAHRIVAQHEGWIKVESREGEGACFTIELPFRTPAEDGKPGEER